MDETFDCPECGTSVEISGLAPGRQVRCGFCRRLLEVPYFPRVVKTEWRRRRFGRPWWVVLAWSVIGLATVAVLTVSLARMIIRHGQASLERSIGELVTASEVAESEGNLSKALIDLDSAIHLRSGSDSGSAEEIQILRQRRDALSLREVGAMLDRLKGLDAAVLPLGDWLNLKARVESDRKLAPLRADVERAMRQKLHQRIDSLEEAAVKAEGVGKPAEALEGCESARALVAHLPDSDRSAIRSRLDAIVDRLVLTRGIVVEQIPGQRPDHRPGGDGTWSLPFLDRALMSRGYLPRPDSSSWRDRWAGSPFRLILQINERPDGKYLTSENRLTRIDARLILERHGRQVWVATPSARTPVPLPNLSAYLSGQIALSSRRSDDFEKMLYDHVRTSIDEKLATALSRMPAWSPDPG
ncbi:MAG: hypothetical protein U0790_25060 [Isosphaeraceae bacterium]